MASMLEAMTSRPQPVLNLTCADCNRILPTLQGFRRHRRDVHNDIPLTKTCTRCKIEKPLDFFGAIRGGQRRRSECNPCRTSGPKQPRTESVVRRDRAAHVRRHFGPSVTLEQYDQAVEKYRAEQDDRCAICQAPQPKCLDHCHETETFRGLLCADCNFGLGRFHDDPALLRAAAEYLRRT